MIIQAYGLSLLFIEASWQLALWFHITTTKVILGIVCTYNKRTVLSTGNTIQLAIPNFFIEGYGMSRE
jgi:hypothetical protein